MASPEVVVVTGVTAGVGRAVARDSGAARAIYQAAQQRRREVYVGGPTLMAIYGQEAAPEFADWYLGKTGYDGQQKKEPVSPNRPDNLFEPVPGWVPSGYFRSGSCAN